MITARVSWKRLFLEIEGYLDAPPLLGRGGLLAGTAAGFAPVEGIKMEFCVVEAVSNSILHAYEGGPSTAPAEDQHCQRAENQAKKDTIRDHTKQQRTARSNEGNVQAASLAWYFYGRAGT